MGALCGPACGYCGRCDAEWEQEPEEIERCRHAIPVDEHCPQCALEALERFKARYGEERKAG